MRLQKTRNYSNESIKHVIPKVGKKNIWTQLVLTYFSEAGNKQAIHLHHLLELIRSPSRVQSRIDICQDFKLEAIWN